jgi:hypothetical protein
MGTLECSAYERSLRLAGGLALAKPVITGAAANPQQVSRLFGASGTAPSRCVGLRLANVVDHAFGPAVDVRPSIAVADPVFIGRYVDDVRQLVSGSMDERIARKSETTDALQHRCLERAF